MEDVEGKLCNTCTETFRGKIPIDGHNTFSNDIIHHQKYCDFVASKDGNCFICTWLWAKHPSPPLTSDNAGDHSVLDGFRISCRADENSGWLDVYFYVTCPWAADFELHSTSHAIL